MSDSRTENLASIATDGAFDVIVLGGGINGIGTFRDLSLQGLRVLLVELNDFCSGCSSAPSRMIHGGLRYLENGEFDLVRESLQERDALLKNAPHMVHPLPTTVPIRSLFSGVFNGLANFIRLPTKPTERGALTVKLGLTLYDWVTRESSLLPRHEFKRAKATRRRWPGLRKDINFTAVFYDAWISHPERLGLELIEDVKGENAQSVALNYCSVQGDPAGDLFLKDTETGNELPVTARAIVNATGAWVDQTAAALPGAGEPATTLVEGTKGSHLIIDHPGLLSALDGHMIYYENSDGRVCILFPYLGKILVGSTDIRVIKPGRTQCEEDEKTYILQSLNHVFPDIKIQPSQIVFSYSGIRPLPKSDQTFTGRISRSHFVKKIDGTVPQFCMIGGKWTTFRAFSEQTTDKVLEELGRHRLATTRDLPIGGGRAFPQNIANWVSQTSVEFEIGEARGQHVLSCYGSQAWLVLKACRDAVDDAPLAPNCSYTAAEIAFLIKRERVVHLGDIILRRTSLAITGEVSTKIIRKIADLAADILDWNIERQNQEVADVIQELGTFHGVSPQTLSSR